MKLRLALRAQQSDEPRRRPDSIDSLYGQHVDQVKRWARRLAGPTADLEDLVHDIFLVALRKGFEHRGEATVDTWLFGITQRVVWSSLRKNKIRQWLFARNQTDLVPPPPQTPQHALEGSEERARLYRALNKLPETYRTTLILYELEELSGEEVARLTTTPLSTVWVRLHRGRERLLKLLAQEKRS